VDITSQGAKSIIFSFEITPERTLQWLVRQATGCIPRSKGDLGKALTWLTSGIWLYDYVGTANVNKMFEAMLYAVRRYGVDVAFIDSLFKCGISSEDYNAQKEFVGRLTDFCKQHGIHIFLVAHARKPPSNMSGRNDDRIPSRDEISGTSDIKNAGFNVLMFWRNLTKHLRLQELRRSPIPDLKTIAELEAKWDGRIRLEKQRFNDGRVGEVPTWFDGPSNQLKTAQGDKPKIYCQ
jgi:twinkle protein